MLDSKYLANMQIHLDGTFKYKFTVSNWVSALRLVSQGNHSQSSRNYFFFYSLVMKRLLCLLLMFNGSSHSKLRYSAKVSFLSSSVFISWNSGMRHKDQQDLGGDGILLAYSAAKPHGGAVEWDLLGFTANWWHLVTPSCRCFQWTL